MSAKAFVGIADIMTPRMAVLWGLMRGSTVGEETKITKLINGCVSFAHPNHGYTVPCLKLLATILICYL